jgi:SAM-dependent methyltransferase
LCGSPLDGTVLHGCDRWFGIDGRFAVRECVRCRVGVTHPRLEGEALARHYPSDYDQWYRSRTSLFRLGMELLTRIRSSLPPFGEFERRRAGDLLDVGCGRGDLAARFRAAGWSAHGLDISPEAVQAAQSAGVEAWEGTLASAPWPDASFDLVVMNHSLEHMPDPMVALRRAYALLRPGGSLIVAVPNWRSWQRRLFGSYWLHVDIPRHLAHYSPEALHAAAHAAGFRRGRTRRYVTAVGLPISLGYRFSLTGTLRGRARQAVLLLAAALYPLTWAIGRPLGGDCVYLVAEK